MRIVQIQEKQTGKCIIELKLLYGEGDHNTE